MIASTMGFRPNCPRTSSPRFVRTVLRVTSSPAEMDRRNDGICVTNPSPIVRRVNRSTDCPAGQP